MRESWRTRLFPGGAVDHDEGRRLADRHLRRFPAEVGRGVFFFGAHLGFGFDAEIVVEGIAIAGVGGEPEGTGERFAVVGERELQSC